MASTAARLQMASGRRGDEPAAGAPRRVSQPETRLAGCACSNRVVFGQPLPDLTIHETATAYRILVPLKGVDLRHVYVFATPRAILVEIRIKTALVHAGTVHKEIQEQRLLRELRLGAVLKEGTTAVRAVGTDLEITCIKAVNAEEKAWSEMVRWDTRASLGCVKSPGIAFQN